MTGAHIIRSLLDDVLLVGPNKPMGYLPLRYIARYSTVTPQWLARVHQERGCASRIFGVGECMIGTGAYFAYHQPHALQALLDTSATLLIGTDWSLDAYEFVSDVAQVTAPQGPIYQLIAAAFAYTPEHKRIS